MGEKRERDTKGAAAAPAKKQKTYTPNPGNLPDGPWKRKSM